jgi:hypothetical protein
MTELNSQNIEHKNLEADIERLSKEIAEKKNLPEYKEISEKELIKQVLQPLIKTTADGERQATSEKRESVEKRILPDYLSDSPAEIKIQVEKLIDSVFHQGIDKVVKTAKQGNPFVLDAFHDALVDKLYEELKKRKLV